MQSGLFGRDFKSITLSNIIEVDVAISFRARIFFPGVIGTVRFMTASLGMGGNMAGMFGDFFTDVKDAYRLSAYIIDLANKSKNNNN